MLVSLQGTKPRNLEQYRQLAESSGKPILESGNYRHGFTVTDANVVGQGTYVLILSMFEERQLGSFEITISSSSNDIEIHTIP
jgi:hypothetical protein